LRTIGKVFETRRDRQPACRGRQIGRPAVRREQRAVDTAGDRGHQPIASRSMAEA